MVSWTNSCDTSQLHWRGIYSSHPQHWHHTFRSWIKNVLWSFIGRLKDIRQRTFEGREGWPDSGRIRVRYPFSVRVFLQFSHRFSSPTASVLSFSPGAKRTTADKSKVFNRNNIFNIECLAIEIKWLVIGPRFSYISSATHPAFSNCRNGVIYMYRHIAGRYVHA